MDESERAHYERQIGDLNATIADLRSRIEYLERENAQLKGQKYEAPALVASVPLAPYDSPVHDNLLKACMQGDDTMVATLINQGANPNHTDALGSTPLHWAAQGGHDRIIPILIAAGANLKAKNVKKLAPQEVAAGKAKTNKDAWKVPKKK